MITKNHIYFDLISPTIYTQSVIKAFVAFCIFWSFAHRQAQLPFCSHGNSIAHFIFCIARMNRNTIKYYMRIAGIKGFKIQFTNSATIYGISKFSTKLFHREVLCTSANFFIRCKCQANLAMLNFRMSQQIFAGRNNFCNTSFIICAQKSSAIRSNNVLSYIIKQFRKITWFKFNAFTQSNISTIVITVNLHFNISSTGFTASIHMCN